MDINLIVTMVKARIGLTSEVRDTYLTAIANAVVTELEGEKGLALDGANPYHLMFEDDKSSTLGFCRRTRHFRAE